MLNYYFAECLLWLIVKIKSTMMNVVMLKVMLNVVILKVVMLNVVAPYFKTPVGATKTAVLFPLVI